MQAYIDAIDPEFRALFDRVQRLIFEAQPTAETLLSYQMPTFKVGAHRLYVGVWKHGVSFYGWQEGEDGGFAARHPDLLSGKGTIRLRADAAEAIDDDEIRELARVALGG